MFILPGGLGLSTTFTSGPAQPSAHWNMDAGESSDETDVIAGLVLTQANNPGSSSGIVNGARSFDPLNSQHFSNTSGPNALKASDSTNPISFALWVRNNLAHNLYSLLNKWKNDGSVAEYDIYLIDASFPSTTGILVPRFEASSNGTIGGMVQVYSSTQIIDSDWHFIACGWSKDQSKVWISVDGGAKEYSAGTLSGVFAGTNFFFIGSDTAGNSILSGALDEITVDNLHEWTDAEIQFLWNNGNGRTNNGTNWL